MAMRFLIAEDDADIAAILSYGLRMHWPNCQVTVATDGEEAMAAFAAASYDLLILDIAMPHLDGLAVCQGIRRVSTVPILMLTARDAMIDKVRALDLGADDYLTKPFDHLEFLARLRALLRRVPTASGAAPPDFAAGDLTINWTTHEVRLRGEVVPLTATEYRLLAVLARNVGQVMPNALLLERVWGTEYAHGDEYIKTFIRRLRQKLDDSADQPIYIQTVWNQGYRFIPGPR